MQYSEIREKFEQMDPYDLIAFVEECLHSLKDKMIEDDAWREVYNRTKTTNLADIYFGQDMERIDLAYELVKRTQDKLAIAATNDSRRSGAGTPRRKDMEWISIESRLPDYLDEVLVSAIEGGGIRPRQMIACLQRTDSEGHHWINPHGENTNYTPGNSPLRGNVTHWVPLPTPPT